MPLSEEYRAKFNVTKAWEFFYQKEGLPYGFRSFVFSLFDTPDNLFAPLTSEFLPILTRITESYPGVYELFIKEAIHHRIGIYEVDKMFKTFKELMIEIIIRRNQTF